MKHEVCMWSNQSARRGSGLPVDVLEETLLTPAVEQLRHNELRGRKGRVAKLKRRIAL